jgi:hypothetical protein
MQYGTLGMQCGHGHRHAGWSWIYNMNMEIDILYTVFAAAIETGYHTCTGI